MVINLSIETPAKAINPMDSKKYIVVKNHVRERTSDIYKSENKSVKNTSEELCERKTKKRKKTVDDVSLISENCNDTLCEDLEELKVIYHKCKAVVAKIETKYGHLLNIDSEDQFSNRKENINHENSGCNCVLNKKIVFDDDGKQVIDNVQQCVADKHICPERLYDRDHHQAKKPVINVSIDEDDTISTLPDNLIELGKILKKLDISINFRNKVIEKIKQIRHQNLDMMRFDKSDLIKKIKLSPDEVINFKGANLSTLQGYPEPNS